MEASKRISGRQRSGACEVSGQWTIEKQVKRDQTGPHLKRLFARDIFREFFPVEAHELGQFVIANLHNESVVGVAAAE